jgi:hypothetical protein
MRLFAALALCVSACSGATTSTSSSSNQQADGVEGGACNYPASVEVNADPTGSGCFAKTPGQICQVSNGATILLDGGVSGGTESCQSMCGASQYEMTCRNVSGPADSLGCQVIPIPTPANVLFYCCPCAG